MRCNRGSFVETIGVSTSHSLPGARVPGRRFAICALVVVVGTISLAGCGGRSVLSLTCKVPLEAKTSSGSVVPIGTCTGLLGSRVAHVSLHLGQSVEISLLQREGLGTIQIMESHSRDLRSVPTPGALGDYIAIRRGTAKLLAASQACRGPGGTRANSSCLIAIVRVT